MLINIKIEKFNSRKKNKEIERDQIVNKIEISIARTRSLTLLSHNRSRVEGTSRREDIRNSRHYLVCRRVTVRRGRTTRNNSLNLIQSQHRHQHGLYLRRARTAFIRFRSSVRPTVRTRSGWSLTRVLTRLVTSGLRTMRSVVLACESYSHGP